MRLIFLSFIAILLVGCATREPDHIITTEYQYVTYQLPIRFVNGCKATKPMKVEEYSLLTLEERENYLANYSISLLGDLKKCDNKINGIIKYIDEVNKIATENSRNKTLEKEREVE